MESKTLSKLFALLLTIVTYSLSYTAIHDTFQIGDNWVYNKYYSSGCCALMGPTMHYDEFKGLNKILIIDKYSKSDSLFYICRNSDSGFSFSRTEYHNSLVDSLKDSTFTDSTWLDTLRGSPFQLNFSLSSRDSQRIIHYHGNSLVLENGGAFTYLQGVGFLKTNLFLPTNEWRFQWIYNIVSFNGMPIDTSLIYSSGTISRFNTQTKNSSLLSVKLHPTFMTFSNIEIGNSADISIFDAKGKLVESGTIQKNNVFYFKKNLNPGFYIVRIHNAGIDYSRNCVLSKS